MRITMENCGNIEIGDLQLMPNVPNIKFACPGTGKSVLARALRAFIQDDPGEKEALQPWSDGTESDDEENWGPELFGYESLTSVACFDQRFVDRFEWIPSERENIAFVLQPKPEQVRRDGKGPRRIHKPLPCNIRILAREAQEEINKVLEQLRYDVRLAVEEGDGEDSPLNGVVLVKLENKLKKMAESIGKAAEPKPAGEKVQEAGEENKEKQELSYAEQIKKQREEEQAKITWLREFPRPMTEILPEADGSINRVVQLIIALMVFRCYAKKMEPSLILIDETELQYPKNILYLMLSVMFCWKDGFKDMTTLYLTRHRYVVADCMYYIREKFLNEPYVTCMMNDAGELTEKQILPENIGLFDELAQAHAKEEIDDVYRLLYLRRGLGHRGKYSLARVMLNGLFAGMTVPEYHNRDMTMTRPMKQDEFAAAEWEIRRLIPEFVYEKALAKLSDREHLAELYFHARSAYEKLMVYQLLIPQDKRESVVQEYIMQVFCEEEDNLIQVDPLVMNTIPDDITERCRCAVEALVKKK